MWNQFINRLLSLIFVLFSVSLIVFLFIHLIPGDPVEVILGEKAQTADREALTIALGLDQPLIIQWQNYMSGLLQGDLGSSLINRRSVSSLIIERLPASIELAVMAFIIAVLIAFPLGLLAAVRKGSGWDYSASSFALIGVGVPNFVFGPLLILIFSVYLGWLPVSGRDSFWSVLLPALTLGTALAAILSRMLRSSLLEVLSEDYIRSAHARGLSPTRVLLQHGVRNALLPMITLSGLQLGALLAGAVITEKVFDWPGLGRLIIEAIQTRDYPLLQGCVLTISVIYVSINMLTDTLYHLIDPRLRRAT